MGNFNSAKTLGMIVGFIIGLAIVYVILKFIRKDHKSKAEYDERQELVRGKAYKYAYLTSLCLIATQIVLSEFTAQFISPIVVTFAILLISVCIYAIYCINKDAYFAINDNPKRFIILSAIVGIINIAGGTFAIVSEGIDFTSTIPTGIINILCGSMFIVIFIAMIIHSMATKED